MRLHIIYKYPEWLGYPEGTTGFKYNRSVCIWGFNAWEPTISISTYKPDIGFGSALHVRSTKPVNARLENMRTMLKRTWFKKID